MTDASSREFAPGDLVRDATQGIDESGTAVVLGYADDHADHCVIDDAGTTVAAVNEDYPPDDDVVEVAFEGWLDSSMPAWPDEVDPDDVGASIRTFADEWGFPVREYAYPESRLEPRPWCRGCGERAEHVATAGWVCTNPDCAEPDVTLDDALNAADEVDDDE